MVARLLALGLLAGAGWLMTRKTGQGSRPAGGSGIDLGLPTFGSSWDWQFDGSDGTADTTTGGNMNQPRGIRNNNPGNVEYDGTPWQGLADPPTDGRFARFVSPEYGIRAMARILDTYRARHGITTVAGIIDRWAPSHENPTNVYASYVAERLGVSPYDRIDVRARRGELIAAMVAFENGQQPYDLATINKGVSMA